MAFGPLVPKRKLMATEGPSEMTKTFVNTLTNVITNNVQNLIYQFLEGEYLPLAGGTMLGNINMGNSDISDGDTYDADTIKLSDNTVSMDSNGVTLKNKSVRLQTSDGLKTATIAPDNFANIALTPYTGGYAHVMESLSVGDGKAFGLIRATLADGYLYWDDSGGTRDHSFCPETTGHGYLGNTSKRWKDGYINNIYCGTSLTIPSEA